MNAFALHVAVFLSCFANLGAAEKKPRVEPDKPGGAAKELTREEIAKLGGFEPGPQADVNAVVRFDVLMVSLSEELAVPLVEMFRDAAKTEAACQKVMALLQSKKAKLTAWPSVATKNGQRAVVENIQEVRYPTEFEIINGAANPGAVAPPPPQAVPPPGPAMPVVAGFVPTAFETRNVGATLEVESTLWPEGQTVEANLCVQHVRLMGWDIAGEQEGGKLIRSAPQPRFQTNKIMETLTLRSGERRFLGVYKLPGSEGQVEIFILGVQVQEAAKPKAVRN